MYLARAGGEQDTPRSRTLAIAPESHRGDALSGGKYDACVRVARSTEHAGARVVRERDLYTAQGAGVVPHVESLDDEGTLVHDPLAGLEG